MFVKKSFSALKVKRQNQHCGRIARSSFGREFFLGTNQQKILKDNSKIFQGLQHRRFSELANQIPLLVAISSARQRKAPPVLGRALARRGGGIGTIFVHREGHKVGKMDAD